MADHDYIDRRLGVMADEALINIQKAIAQIRSQAAGTGNLGNSRTHLQYHETAKAKLRETLEGMATFTYNACDGISEEAAQAMERAGQKVVSGLIAWLQDLGKNSGGGYLGLGPPISQLEARLQEIVHHVVDDFRHEMVGVMRLKKDPLVNVVSNITNSPGAAQQTVVGDHNQQSLQQQNSDLIKVINELLASDEFKSLSEPNRFAVQDATDLLRDEIAKPNPDQSKIRRWAGHLLGFAKEFGMHLAATALTKLLMT